LVYNHIEAILRQLEFRPAFKEEIMRLRALKQSCLAIAQIIAIAACLSAQSAAQTPNPAPSPSPAAPSTGTSLSENLANLASRAIVVVAEIELQLEGPLLPFLERLSLLLAALIMIAAFAKLWRENAGAGVDLFWWFARLGVIFALLGNGPRLVNEMSEIGQTLAVQDGAGSTTALAKFCDEQQSKFNEAYNKLTTAAFIIDGQIGVINSDESSLPSPDRKLGAVSKSMPVLLDTMNVSRSVISFGDLFLSLLSRFLRVAMRLAAPLMIALAIDRSLAQQVTYPFVWGVVALTTIWPALLLIIKSVVYLVAYNGVVSGADRQFFKYDPNTMRIFHNGVGEPTYIVSIAAVTMLIGGLSLWATPYIAYQLIGGKVYEIVSSAASTVGNVIQYYGASLAASVLQQSVTSQAARSAPAPRDESPNARASSFANFTRGANQSLPLRKSPVADQLVFDQKDRVRPRR
jgi:hypothetical protein